MLPKEQKEKTLLLSNVINKRKKKRYESPLDGSLVEMHVTNWVTAQKEDPELEVVLQWLESKKTTDLRTLLREQASSEEGQMIWRNHQNFTTL